jgi:hypothetical protein
MAPIGSFDIQATLALGVALFLICCLAVLYSIRDRTWSPPRRVTRTLWCPTLHRRATIDVRERVSTGMVIRDLERCSLLDEGEQCHRACLIRRVGSTENPSERTNDGLLTL